MSQLVLNRKRGKCPLCGSRWALAAYLPAAQCTYCHQRNRHFQGELSDIRTASLPLGILGKWSKFALIVLENSPRLTLIIGLSTIRALVWPAAGTNSDRTSACPFPCYGTHLVYKPLLSSLFSPSLLSHRLLLTFLFSVTY